MGKKPNANAWRGMTGVFATLLAATTAGTAIANANTAVINTRLGTVNDVIVDEGGTTDNIYYDSEFSTLSEMYDAKAALAEEISEEGTVLFKNDNRALPLSKDEKVTLWGLNSHYPTLGGMIGSSTSTNAEAGQPSYGIEEAMTEKGFTLNQDFIDLYSGESVMGFMRRGFGQPGHGLTPAFTATYENQSAYPVGEIPAEMYSEELLSSADDTAAIVVISRDSSEAADYYPTEENTTEGDTYERPLALSDYERATIELAKQHSTKVIVMLNADNPMEIEELKNDSAIDSILWVGAPGVYGFLGVADVLSGEVNPSGRIADTYAANSISSPAMMNFGVYTYTNASVNGGELTETNKADWYAVETEGIYVGYKYYETRYEDEVLERGNAASNAGAYAGSTWTYADEVTYPFGYGLSYTTFEEKLDSAEVSVGEIGTAKVTVTNTGDTAGKDVVQLYVQAPYTEGGLEKSAIQLIGFAKTSVLEPGASETVEIEIDPTYFASYDENLTKEDGTVGAWVLEAGDYYFAVGDDAHAALNNVLANKNGSDENLVQTAETDDAIEADNAILWNLADADAETYSVNVQNQLQAADINKQIPDTAEYTTRADWTKGWKTVDSITPTEEMMVGLTNSNYTLNANGDGETWGVDSGLKLIDMVKIEDGKIVDVTPIDDEKWDTLLAQLSLDEAIQFIEKGGDDIENVDSILLPRLYENDGPLGFTYDQVGGYYVRWSASEADRPTYVSKDDEKAEWADNIMPTEPIVAATFNKELVEREGELLGDAGLWAKETGIIAPGVNIHRVPYNARNHEYYSEDGVLTGIMGTCVSKGIESKGMQAQPKHFAFNHQETNRSGLSVFMTEQGARETELRAFQMMMSTNTNSSVMTAFNRLGTVFVGANENLLTNIARGEWGYTGSFVTDMINGADYMNWRDITAAGGGNCLTTSAYETSEIGTMAASKSKIAKDTYFQSKMKQNIKYWLYNLAQSNGMNGLSYTSEMKFILAWWQIAIICAVACSAVLTILFGALFIVKSRKLNRDAVKVVVDEKEEK